MNQQRTTDIADTTCKLKYVKAKVVPHNVVVKTIDVENSLRVVSTNLTSGTVRLRYTPRTVEPRTSSTSE